MNNVDLKTTSWLIVSHIVVMLTAGLILIFSFDFPNILRAPMEETLSLFHKNRGLTVPAYYLFTLSGITFMGVVLLLYKTLNFQNSTSAYLAQFFGVLFGLTSSLGFVRWPFLMDNLGALLASADAEQIESIRLVYNSFHTYAGVSIGENFAFWFEFLWMFLFSIAMLSKTRVFPKYLGRIGQLLGLGMLVYSLEQFGGVFSILGPLNMVVHTAQLAWLLALAFAVYNFALGKSERLSLMQRIISSTFFALLLVASFV